MMASHERAAPKMPSALPVVHHVAPEVRQTTKSSIRPRLREALLVPLHVSACAEAVQQPHTFSPKTKSFSGHKEVSESIQIQQDYESGICKGRNGRDLINLDIIRVLNSSLACIEV